MNKLLITMRTVTMTRRQALFIKSLRVNKEYAWSAIHAEFIQRYTYNGPFTGKRNIEGSQIDGMYLCESAMNKLKEKQEEGWFV